jgi:hypothetical protein
VVAYVRSFAPTTERPGQQEQEHPDLVRFTERARRLQEQMHELQEQTRKLSELSIGAAPPNDCASAQLEPSRQSALAPPGTTVDRHRTIVIHGSFGREIAR